MGDLRGWAIDLPSVYGRLWRSKEKFSLREDLFESPDKKFAALLYGIAEVGISKEIGRLAVFHNKENPKIILNPPRLECWYLYDSAVQFGQESLLFVHLCKFSRNRFSTHLCALDHGRQESAFIEQLSGDCYGVRHVVGTKYAFKKMSPDSSSQETIVELSELKWKPLNTWAGKLADYAHAFLRRVTGP